MIPLPLAFPALRTIRLAAGLLVLIVLATLLHIRTGQRDTAIAHAAAVQASFDQSVATYRAARDQARRDDQLNTIRVGMEQAAISREVTDDYQARIDRLRADHARRLHAAQAIAGPGGGGGSGLSGTGETTGRADGATGETRLPLADALIASEQAERLAALQAWVRAQASVDVNGAARPPANGAGASPDQATADSRIAIVPAVASISARMPTGMLN